MDDFSSWVPLTVTAHVDFDLFCAVDGLEEIELGKGAIGTTKKGEAPFLYLD